MPAPTNPYRPSPGMAGPIFAGEAQAAPERRGPEGLSVTRLDGLMRDAEQEAWRHGYFEGEHEERQRAERAKRESYPRIYDEGYDDGVARVRAQVAVSAEAAARELAKVAESKRLAKGERVALQHAQLMVARILDRNEALDG